jgi:hypothetical protein
MKTLVINFNSNSDQGLKFKSKHTEEADGHCLAGRDEVEDLIKVGRVFPLNVPLLQSYFRREQTGAAET